MQFIDLKSQYKLIEKKLQQSLANLFEHGQFIMGPEVSAMEERLADYVGAKYCIGCSNGTDALLMVLMALDVRPGDEVITSNFSFFAAAEVIALLGAKPVLVDIDPRTYNADPEKIEQQITERTKVIMPVSLYGQPADMRRINLIGEKYKIPVIEDGAQSFGATHHGKRSGNLALAGCVSFFPAKPLGCYGDGGAIFTSDEGLAEALREILHHGERERYQHVRLGINGRLDSMQAAVILAKMDVFPREVELRQEVAKRYDQFIGQTLGDRVTTPFIDESNTSIYAQYTIKLDRRDEVAAKLRQQGIPTAIHYPKVIHDQPALKDVVKLDTPHAVEMSGRVMSLPMHPYLSVEDQQKVVSSLSQVMS